MPVLRLQGGQRLHQSCALARVYPLSRVSGACCLLAWLLIQVLHDHYMMQGHKERDLCGHPVSDPTLLLLRSDGTTLCA